MGVPRHAPQGASDGPAAPLRWMMRRPSCRAASGVDGGPWKRGPDKPRGRPRDAQTAGGADAGAGGGSRAGPGGTAGGGGVRAEAGRSSGAAVHRCRPGRQRAGADPSRGAGVRPVAGPGGRPPRRSRRTAWSSTANSSSGTPRRAGCRSRRRSAGRHPRLRRRRSRHSVAGHGAAQFRRLRHHPRLPRPCRRGQRGPGRRPRRSPPPLRVQRLRLGVGFEDVPGSGGGRQRAADGPGALRLCPAHVLQRGPGLEDRPTPAPPHCAGEPSVRTQERWGGRAQGAPNVLLAAVLGSRPGGRGAGVPYHAPWN